MRRAVLDALTPRPGETAADATAGLGGHAEDLARRVAPGGTIVLNDWDESNLARARARIESLGLGVRVVAYRGNFADLPRRMEEDALAADVVLADLGFSSNQMADAARGLSFQREGPLDMRLDRTMGLTAADLVNSLAEGELARIIRDLGEERGADRVARKLVTARAAEPILTTARLAQLVRGAIPARGGGIDPATKTFQALRIAVNDELGSLDALLAAVVGACAGRRAWLRAGARVGVIAFHSLEDRRVKQAFREVVAMGGRDLTGGLVTPGEDEVGENPRARSAKFRAASIAGG